MQSLWRTFHCTKRYFALCKLHLPHSFITWKCSELCFLLSVLFLKIKRKLKQRSNTNFKARWLQEQISVPLLMPFVPLCVSTLEPWGIVLENGILDRKEKKFAVKTWYWGKHFFWLCNFLVEVFSDVQARYLDGGSQAVVFVLYVENLFTSVCVSWVTFVLASRVPVLHLWNKVISSC